MYLLHWQKFENNVMPSVPTIADWTKDEHLTLGILGINLLAIYDVSHLAQKEEMEKSYLFLENLYLATFFKKNEQVRRDNGSQRHEVEQSQRVRAALMGHGGQSYEG